MILATVLLIGTFAVTADAAMKKTVKNQKTVWKLSTVNKKATKVKKGTTNLTYTKGQGYIKFTAPKTKTYTFTFSNYKMKGDTAGHIDFFKKDKYDSTRVDWIDVTTKGGKSDVLWMKTTGFKEDTTGKVVDRFLHKRYGKVKLKKGETVYIHLYSATKKKATMKLVIK